MSLIGIAALALALVVSPAALAADKGDKAPAKSEKREPKADKKSDKKADKKSKKSAKKAEKKAEKKDAARCCPPD